MRTMSAKKLNESFKWTKVCKIEPHLEEIFDESGESTGKEITKIDLVLENGERIRIDGFAYRPPPDEPDMEPLCTLRIRKADWKEVTK